MEFSKIQKTLIICCIFIIAASTILIGTQYFFTFLILLLIFLFFNKKSFSYKFILICFFVFVLSSLYTLYKTPKVDILYYLAQNYEVLQGRIISFPEEKNGKLKFELQCEYLIRNNKILPLKAKTLVSIIDTQEKINGLEIGNKIIATGLVKRPFKATNPYQFDYAKYLKNSNIFTVMYVKSHNYKLLEKPAGGIWFIIQKSGEIRDQILDVHKNFLKEPNFEVLGGIVFGSTAINPSQEIKDDFINSGL